MKEVVFFIINIVECAVKGSMLVWFLRGMVKERNGWDRLIGKSFVSYAQAAVVAQYIMVQMLLNGIPQIQRFLYGDYGMPSASVVTIFHVMTAMAGSFLVSMFVYERQKGKLFCYIAIFLYNDGIDTFCDILHVCHRA